MYQCPLIFLGLTATLSVSVCVCMWIKSRGNRKWVGKGPEHTLLLSGFLNKHTHMVLKCNHTCKTNKKKKKLQNLQKAEQSLVSHARRHKATQMIKSFGKLAVAVRLRFKGEQQAGCTCYSRYSKRAKLNFKRLPFVIHLLTARALSVKIKRGYQSAGGGQQRDE